MGPSVLVLAGLLTTIGPILSRRLGEDDACVGERCFEDDFNFLARGDFAFSFLSVCISLLFFLR